MKPRRVLVQIEMTTDAPIADITSDARINKHVYGTRERLYDCVIHSVKVTPASRKRKRVVREDPAPNSLGGDGDRNLSSWDAGR